MSGLIVGFAAAPSPSGFGASFGWAYTNVRDEVTVLGPLAEGALNAASRDVPSW